MAMLVSAAALMGADLLVHVNLAAMIPDTYLQAVGLTKVGLCELFCLLFVIYECISILKKYAFMRSPGTGKIKELAGRISGKYDSRTSGGNRRSGTAETAETEQRQSSVIINY